ncbi:hypothetical protein FB451DRAFT_443212 [Mycena latifolia]|nr:hypothetical protein FB451DRAFT_443212 [Mycena latifolia]
MNSNANAIIPRRCFMSSALALLSSQSESEIPNISPLDLGVQVSSVSCPMPALPPQSSPHAVSDNHPTLFTSDLPQNFGLIAPSPFIAPSPPPLSDFGPVLPSTPPAPAGFTNFTINISPTGTIISSSAPVLAPAAPTHSLPLTFNNSFNTPQPAPPPPPHLSTPFLPPTADPNVPNAKWVLLCRRFPATQLAAHKWTWTAGDWLPEYEHPPISRITAVWDEWADGIEGCIPVELLTKTWGAGWKRNIGKLKTENNRRMKIIKLVQELSALPGWSVDFATTFLSEQYEPRYKARAFSDYLTKDNGKNKPAVLKAADLYLKQRRQRCT